MEMSELYEQDINFSRGVALIFGAALIMLAVFYGMQAVA